MSVVSDSVKFGKFGKNVVKIFDEINGKNASASNLKRDNANINGDTSMGSMLQMGANNSKEYNLEYLIPEDISKLHREGYIHIHDLDFYTLTTTCTQIELRKLFKTGFNTGHGYIRPPKSIRSAASLAAVIVQANQNDQHGGQSICDFDYAMGDLVEVTYNKYLKEFDKFCDSFACGLYEDSDYDCKKKEYAMNKTTEETYQAMEAFIHNLNSMHSRAGAQVPFSSINYGMDTRWSGMLAIEQLLKATEAGLGHGETPIFPIQIFRVKEGVNYNPGDPGYPLLEHAVACSAKRLFPNFSFIDAPFNLQYYKPGHPETEVGYMGCRTRVMGNVCGPEVSPGRGNLSFTSINLPRLAIESMNEAVKELSQNGSFSSGRVAEIQKIARAKFYGRLNALLNKVMEQLMHRFKIQIARHVYNYPFLMGNGVWIDSEYLNKNDTLEEVLKHGTLSIGFCGLAECLTELLGEHHGQSAEAQEEGLRIIGRIRDYCDEKSKELELNVTCLATPAEALAGRFLKKDREEFGVIEGVTDRDYYTNSFHVPVYHHITAMEKIALEAPYHALTNAGHISYIELDGDPSRNLDAFMRIVRYMKECGIGYGSVNHPVDQDPVCGYTGIIYDVCPNCGRTINSHKKRITCDCDMMRRVLDIAERPYSIESNAD